MNVRDCWDCITSNQTGFTNAFATPIEEDVIQPEVISLCLELLTDRLRHFVNTNRAKQGADVLYIRRLNVTWCDLEVLWRQRAQEVRGVTTSKAATNTRCQGTICHFLRQSVYYVTQEADPGLIVLSFRQSHIKFTTINGMEYQGAQTHDVGFMGDPVTHRGELKCR